MDTLIVYSPQENNKLKYILDYLLMEQCALEYRLTDDRKVLEGNLVVNYSAETISGAINIEYSLYLNQLIEIPDFDKYLQFDEQGRSNFDFIAAIFFLLARVEEYDSKSLDEHGRYKYQESELFKKNLLDEPVIDLWMQAFRKQLQKQFNLELKQVKYSFLSTIDIDHIYAYKHKSFIVRAGSFFKDLLNFNSDRIKDRTKEKDPYDRLSDMLSWHKALQIKPTFFVLTAQRSTYDKSLPPNNFQFIEKIAALSNQAELGLHPSYMSNSNIHILKKEKRDLEAILNSPIEKSRQHYLKLSWPETYRRLIELSIRSDYTMGYSTTTGFRAGTSRSFFWYDLNNDQATALELVPFQLMDVTLKQYKAMSPTEGLEAAKKIVDKIKAVQGTSCILWHNSSFYAAEGWEGWEDMYKTLLAYAV